MKTLPIINLVAIIHLVFLSLWGGVVATEAVLELYPYRRRELHSHSIRYHFWIDLLVELPLILGVIASGLTLVILAWPLSTLHLLKISAAAVAVSANLICVLIVFRRRKSLEQGAEDKKLWGLTRRIVLCAVIGLPFAGMAGCLGFYLAYQRLLKLCYELAISLVF